MKTVLITGSAGFIGYHTAERYLTEGWRVVGLDAFTEYYDPQLKRDRAARLARHETYIEVENRVEGDGVFLDLFKTYAPDVVIHLAAQAGVRYSIDAPRSYMEANIQGTFELLEAARAHPGAHLMIASTSSVYGANTEMPYSERHKADSQMSFYAATKKATEAMAHSYAHLYDLPVTMFRFFTVYGPWGRPDMALFKFTRAMLAGEAIDVYNHGKMQRDFTYVDDLVTSIVGLAKAVPERNAPQPHDSLSPVAPWRVVNIGNSEPVQLLDFIEAIEASLGMTANKNMMEMQPGDVPATWADATLLDQLTGGRPATSVADGVKEFVSWYRDYYNV
jgi:UDP-glucuronate 4-epimerase